MAIVAARSTPYAEIEFHTPKQLYAVSRGDGGWSTIQPTRDLLTVQTQKDLSAPIGTFQITLTGARGSDGMDWYDRLQENNLVVIKMGRPPERMGTVMVGLIDEVRRMKSIDSGADAQQRVLVRGSDFGKILSKAMLLYYPALANAPLTAPDSFYQTPAGWVAMYNFFVGSDLLEGTPDQLIENAIVKILFRIMNVSVKYWDSRQGVRDVGLPNILRYIMAQSPYLIPFILTMVDDEGSFWNFIEKVSEKPFNELFIDTRGYMPNEVIGRDEPEAEEACIRHHRASFYTYTPGLTPYMQKNGVSDNPDYCTLFGEDQARVVLYLRNTPFEYEDWNKLYTHTIDYSELKSEDLGRSDSENYNTFLAYNSISVPDPTNLKLLVPPVVDKDNAKIYGMNPLEVELYGLDATDPNGVTAAQNLSQMLYRWYHLNREYKSGIVTVKGSAYYKVGQRLCIQNCEYNPDTGKWDDLYFYIEGVQQQFTVMQGWLSTLTLTRGQRKDTTQPLPVSPVVTNPTPTKTNTTPNSQHYTVKHGDTLWGIAHHFYGRGLKWTKIWNANKNALIARDHRDRTDPGHWIYPGQTLIIPN